MRGEDLQGLNIEELQQLETSLEAGLNHVVEMKVCLQFTLLVFCTITGFMLSLVFPLINMSALFQTQKMMDEISELESKV